jgi:hypothetical protein
VSRRTSFAGSYVGSNANLLPGGWGNARNSIEDERWMAKKMRKKEERGERKEEGGGNVCGRRRVTAPLPLHCSWLLPYIYIYIYVCVCVCGGDLYLD